MLDDENTHGRKPYDDNRAKVFDAGKAQSNNLLPADR